MKYAIIGAGGTGGVLGYKLASAGRDVTLIARGAHLQAMRENGLTLRRMWDGIEETIPVKAASMEEYAGNPDVILVCVKGYSLGGVYDFIRRVAGPETVVIPILNIYGTGATMQKELPGMLVTDGCMYVSANIDAPGKLLMHGEICRVVFGVRNAVDFRPALNEIQQDMQECGIRTILSDNIRRDALQKFSYVAPIGAAGLYYDCTAAEFQREGEQRELFKAMVREIVSLAEAMDIHFSRDLVEVNLKILANLPPEATTSMQRDVAAGRESEIDGLVFSVVRLAHELGVAVPNYEKVAAALGGRWGDAGRCPDPLKGQGPLRIRQ